MAQLKLQNWSEAIADSNKCLSFDASFVKAYHRRGYAYLGLKDYAKAIKDFEFLSIIQNDPETILILKQTQEKY